MGIKKRRIVNYTGHLLKPFYRYITKAEIFLSPIDNLGNSLATRLHSQFTKFNSKLIQPGYQCTIKENSTSANSYMLVHYSIGWVNKYVLTNKT
jgi:hypothetical protein